MKKEVLLVLLLSLVCVQASFIETVKSGMQGDLPIFLENKFTFMILSMGVLAVIVSLVYHTSKVKILQRIKVEDPYLFKETIEGLNGKEKEVCNVLNETEGIREGYLLGKLSIKENELKKVLKTLEKRQIIKERKSSVSKIYLSEWLK